MSLLQGDVLPRSVAKNALRQRVYASTLDYFCAPKAFPTQIGVDLGEDLHIMLKFWTTMLQDRKHVKASAIGDLEGLDPALQPPTANRIVSSINGGDTLSLSSEWRAPSVVGGGSTLNKRSASRMMMAPPTAAGTMVKPTADSFVKDYTKKLSLILALLSVEIECVAVNENPLKPREELVTYLETRPFSGIMQQQVNVGKQFDDAMKYLEDVRKPRADKVWREQARHAWEVSPALAVFLPQRLNSSQVRRIGHNCYCRIHCGFLSLLMLFRYLSVKCPVWSGPFPSILRICLAHLTFSLPRRPWKEILPSYPTFSRGLDVHQSRHCPYSALAHSPLTR